MRVVRGKRNLIFCSHAGPGTQEKGSDHAISTVMIIDLVDKMVIWGVSEWIIGAVGQEVSEMFF